MNYDLVCQLRLQQEETKLRIKQMEEKHKKEIDLMDIKTKYYKLQVEALMAQKNAQ